MKIIIDRVKLQRRAAASHAASLGGLLLMLASVAVSLWKPQLSTLTAGMLFLGFATSTSGIYFANRWVKKPRPEEVLDRALKGLDERHRLYHYPPRGPEHVLLTPGGVVVLETRSGEGYFEYRDGRWRQKITMGKAVRFFVEERLGDPIAEASGEASRLAAALARASTEAAAAPVIAMVVFTHPNVELIRKGTPIPVLQPKQLRGELPKGQPSLRAEIYERLRSIFDAGGPY